MLFLFRVGSAEPLLKSPPVWSPFCSFAVFSMNIQHESTTSPLWPDMCLRVCTAWNWLGWRWGEGGVGLRLVHPLKSLSSSGPRVTRWADSCLTFSNANDGGLWKPQIGPLKSSVWCLVGPCSCRRPWFFFSLPTPPGLLCAVVIGTDVPLASHRATFS